MQLGLRELARFGQSVTQVGLRVGVVRMQADSGAIVRNCLEELILRSKRTCQIVLGVKIVWLRPERGIQIWYGIADATRGQETRAQGIIAGMVVEAMMPDEFAVQHLPSSRPAVVDH